jgi:hypothetical protein
MMSYNITSLGRFFKGFAADASRFAALRRKFGPGEYLPLLNFVLSIYVMVPPQIQNSPLLEIMFRAG